MFIRSFTLKEQKGSVNTLQIKGELFTDQVQLIQSLIDPDGYIIREDAISLTLGSFQELVAAVNELLEGFTTEEPNLTA